MIVTEANAKMGRFGALYQVKRQSLHPPWLISLVTGSQCHSDLGPWRDCLSDTMELRCSIEADIGECSTLGRTTAPLAISLLPSMAAPQQSHRRTGGVLKVHLGVCFSLCGSSFIFFIIDFLSSSGQWPPLPQSPSSLLEPLSFLPPSRLGDHRFALTQS